MKFLVDLRGLNDEQRRFISDHLQQSSNNLTVGETQNDFITIELSDAQKVAFILTHGTDIRQCLAGMVESAYRRRGDLFMSNAQYGWLGRTRLLS